MTTETIEIKYEVYHSLDEMSREDRVLANEALQAMKGSYAPYSHFNVGAAVRMSGGQIVRGANQENAAYPSGLCAERCAMFAASAQYPDYELESLAVTGGFSGIIAEIPATPCGACRQVMAQYQNKAGKPVSVILVGSREIWKFRNVDSILPFIFDNIK